MFSNKFCRFPWVTALVALILVEAPVAGGAPVSRPQLIREFYLKETGVEPEKITAIAVGADGRPWLVADGKLARRNSTGWETLDQPRGVRGLLALHLQGPDALIFAAAADGIWAIAGDRHLKEPSGPAQADLLVAGPDGEVWAVANGGADRGIWARGGGWRRIGEIDTAAGKVKSVCRVGALNLAATDRGLFKLLPGKPWVSLQPPGGANNTDLWQVASFGTEHSIVLSSRGPSLTDIAAQTQTYAFRDSLPIESPSCVTVAGDTVWFGSEQGVMRWHAGRFNYFAGPRWLPDDRVIALGARGDEAWVATRGGLSHIFQRPMTLQQKSDYYQQLTESRPRRFGYVTVMSLKTPGRLDQAEQEISDNDGLWTAMYVASQCFRYAVTHDENARAQARRSMQALLRLESITGIPGFPARAISNIHDPAHERRSGGQWHPSPVEKDWMWKGDTSSDEIVGHYLAFYLYSTLVANEREKAQVRATCKRITDHILDHGYYLVDITGKPTRWGYWSPARLNGGRGGDRGLNSLEILSHLKVAIHLVGDERYATAYRDLIENHHYALNTIRQRVSFNGRVNHSDDELAFLSYYPLLVLEDDPALKAIYQTSVRRSWEGVRPEACPLWNFIYGACSGQSCDAEQAVDALYEIPLDLIHWPTANARRADLKLDPAADRFGRKQLLRPLPWTERPMHKWNNNPYELDGGDPHEEEDPTFWLLPYWMGRYHQLIPASS
jgi:hypothetical protein